MPQGVIFMSLSYWKYAILNHITTNFRTFLFNIIVAILGEIALFLVLSFVPKDFINFSHKRPEFLSIVELRLLSFIECRGTVTYCLYSHLEIPHLVFGRIYRRFFGYIDDFSNISAIISIYRRFDTGYRFTSKFRHDLNVKYPVSLTNHHTYFYSNLI